MSSIATDILVRGNYFCNNNATNRGGAIYMDKASRVKIDGNMFTGNTGTNYGSAIFLLGNSNQEAGVLVTSNIFFMNLPAANADIIVPNIYQNTPGTYIGLTNNSFDKANQAVAVNGNFNNPAITPDPNAGNNYASTYRSRRLPS